MGQVKMVVCGVSSRGGREEGGGTGGGLVGCSCVTKGISSRFRLQAKRITYPVIFSRTGFVLC